MDTVELPVQRAGRSRAGMAIAADEEPALPLAAAAVLARIIRASLQQNESDGDGAERIAGAA